MSPIAMSQAMYGDTTNVAYMAGQQDAFQLLGQDSLVVFRPAHVTHLTQSYLPTVLLNEFDIAIVYYDWLLLPDETPEYESAYIEGFNMTMERHILRLHGEDVFARAWDRAKYLAYTELWETQEDSVGVRVEGWASSYPTEPSLGPTPTLPVFVWVTLDDDVCYEGRAGWARELSLITWDNPTPHSARAMAIVAELRFVPLSGRELETCALVVPIHFTEED